MSLAKPRTDKEYEARWDAETLANAERIKADPTRLSSAQSAAKAMAEQQDEKQKAMRKVAGRKPTRSPDPPKAFQGRSGPNNPPPKQGSGFNVFQKIGG